MAKKNAAIIGYGGMGGWHGSFLQNSDVVNLMGIYDIKPSRCEAAEAKGIHAYASLEELLADPQIDFITIATPNDFHKPIALQAFAAGKHVISEKPVALSSADLQEMIDAANAAAKRQIAAANAKTAKVADELMRYKNQIGVPADFVPWKDGSKEARENIKAQVTKVAGDYGYIVVNIGSSTKVLQYTGVNEKNNPAKPLTVAVKPLIKKGFKFNVYRKGIAGEAELIAMIVLDQVGSHESIANIPVDAEIKVGDYLMFAAEK